MTVGARPTYPFEDGPQFVSNAWYVAAWSAEVTDVPIARTMLERSIVLYRRSDGSPVALANRCPHRGLPLVMGSVHGDEITCAYHGFTYDSGGLCRRIPSQERVPPGIAVSCFPAVERWQWIWVWMGDPAAADETLIPDSDDLGVSGPPWVAAPGADFTVRARFQLFNENLLDSTHLPFLHGETIGTAKFLDTPMQIDVDGRTVRVSRDTRDEQASAFYARRFGIREGERIDRRHITTFIAPSFHIIHLRVSAAGSAPDAPVYGEHKILHAITPETTTSLHDFWAMTRTYNTGEEMTGFIRDALNGVIRQDIVALEAVEVAIDTSPIVEYSCAADAASLKARKVVQELLRAERP